MRFKHISFTIVDNLKIKKFYYIKCIKLRIEVFLLKVNDDECISCYV